MKELNNLPNELLVMIFDLLSPYRDLENCQLVCKKWADLVKNVRFRRNVLLHRAMEKGNLGRFGEQLLNLRSLVDE
ncbi:hypothetical protein DMENIID0001_165230 [Sergentomyia squamirostris]